MDTANDFIIDRGKRNNISRIVIAIALACLYVGGMPVTHIKRVLCYVLSLIMIGSSLNVSAGGRRETQTVSK
jgi:hypothetical protein